MADARVHAPELHGEWVAGGPLSLAGLRGRVVLLDFWTLACINCLHAVEELRGLERRFAGELVVIGVHSPKFAHERETAAVRQAIERHRIEHPVIHDRELRTWDAYAVRAWPTFVVVDPQGRIAATASGEGHAATLAATIESLLARAGGAGGEPAGAEPPPREPEGSGELSFPGKVCAAPDGRRLAIADSGHDRVLVTTLAGEVLEELEGLYQPQGVRFDGPDALLVCEQGAHRVWRVALGGGRRELVTDRLRSPWDIVRWRGHVVIAEAGRHRLWALDADGEPQVIAGTGEENIVDGPALEALLAQPSGLAVSAAGDLVFADSESSALRRLRGDGTVETLVGHGLFVSGDADGDRDRARLQHPLGVAATADGALYVADTFNGLIRVHRGAHLWTVPVEGFLEPGGIDALPDGRLVVADTGNHRVVLVDPVEAAAVALDVGRPASSDTAAGAPAAVAATVVQERGSVLHAELDVDVGDDMLDPSAGPPVQVLATATDDRLLAGPVAWRLDVLPAVVDVPLGEGSGRVTLELRVATCAPDACRLRRTQRAYDVLLHGIA